MATITEDFVLDLSVANAQIDLLESRIAALIRRLNAALANAEERIANLSLDG